MTTKERLYKELKLPQAKKINPERLYEELQNVLGDKIVSMDTGTQIVVRADVSATDEDADLVEAIIRQHDPTQLSKREQRAVDRDAAKERLKALDLSDKKKLKLDDLAQAIEDLRKIVLHDG